MAKSRLVTVNLVTATATTITGSSEVTNRPASYLKSAARWKKWRSSTTTGDQNVIADFGSLTTIKCVAIVDWKRHAGGAVRADYWDGAAWQVFGTYAIPSANPTKLLTLWNTTGVSGSKIRIYFTNTLAGSDYVEIGVVIAGTYYQPTYTVVDGFELRLVDPSIIVAAADGQEEAQSRTAFHVLQGGYDYMPEADVDAFRSALATVGGRSPFLFAADPDDDDLNLYGRFSTGLTFRQRAARNYDIPIAVQEVR
jgi:hypothetical protein